LLSSEFIASIIICGTFVMAIRTFMGFSQNISTLRPKLDQVENVLNRIRLNLQTHKERIENLNIELNPIQELEQKMRTHYEIIQDLALDEEKKNLEEEKEAGSGGKRTIERKKKHPN